MLRTFFLSWDRGRTTNFVSLWGLISVVYRIQLFIYGVSAVGSFCSELTSKIRLTTNYLREQTMKTKILGCAPPVSNSCCNYLKCLCLRIVRRIRRSRPLYKSHLMHIDVHLKEETCSFFLPRLIRSIHSRMSVCRKAAVTELRLHSLRLINHLAETDRHLFILNAHADTHVGKLDRSHSESRK